MKKDKEAIRHRFRTAEGQDITEYTLLLAFVVVVSAAIFLIQGNDIRTVWEANSRTVNAARVVAGS